MHFDFIKKIIITVCVFLSALIGAGVASGIEIYSYFIDDGAINLVSLLSAIVLIFIFFYIVFMYCQKNKVYDFYEFTKKLFGEKHFLFFYILYAFLAIPVGGAMVSGGGTLIEKIFSIPALIGRIIILAMGMLIVWKNIKGLGQVGFCAVILIICASVYMTAYMANDISNLQLSTNITYSGIFFGLYNFALSASVIPSLAKTADKREMKISVLVSALLLTIILFWISVVVSFAQITELPLLDASFEISFGFGIFYGIVIFISVITTLAAVFYTFKFEFEYKKNFAKAFKYQIYIGALMCFAVSFIPLDQIVEILYPFLGIFGIIITIRILYVNNKFKSGGG